MKARYAIAPARGRDIARLAAVELAAAQLLRDHAPASILQETTSAADFEAARAAGRLWVALVDDAPVGFALVEMLGDGRPHLEEISVHPAHGRRGIGTALVRTVCDWAARSRCTAITLTTFRAVPWNMPFYARLGFVEVSPGVLCPELVQVVNDETRRGLDPRRRVVMRYVTRFQGSASEH